MKLTKAGELALNKISVQNIVTSALPTISSNAKVISTGGKQINQPVKIITLNSPKPSSNVGKIQSKPIVINAPYVIPQINRSSANKIQPENGEKKGPKIIRLTPQQFADLKSGTFFLRNFIGIYMNQSIDDTPYLIYHLSIYRTR